MSTIPSLPHKLALFTCSFARMIARQGMAVWTENLQVIYAIIEPITVHMVQFQRNRLPPPDFQSTPFTMPGFQAIVDKSQFQLMGSDDRILEKILYCSLTTR